MCFYLAATAAAKTLEARFNAAFPDANLFEPAGEVNAFAHPALPVITSEKPKQIELFRWGLIPAWVNDPDSAKTFLSRTLNARAETADERPSFRNSLRYRRCLVPATAFFEWRHEGKKKIKYRITAGQEIMCLAGIWDSWRDPLSGEEWKGFSILTTAANPLMEVVHNSKKRMPVILKEEDERKWLDPERSTQEQLRGFFEPYPDELMKAEQI